MKTHNRTRHNRWKLKNADQISELAESLADLYFPEDSVIDPSVIAEDYGLTWSHGNYQDAFDGLLEYHRGRFHIYINIDRQQTPRRQRFTFAHELGHFFIDGHRNALANGEVPYYSSFTNFSSEQLVEREADFFSANLLMPHRRTLNAYRDYDKFGATVINGLSSHFDTSRLSTLIRLFYLDVYPFMIVRATDRRIQSIRYKPGFGFYPKYKKDMIPSGTLMNRYFKTGEAHGIEQALPASYWFDTRQNMRLWEYCLCYDQYNTCYSILWVDRPGRHNKYLSVR